MRTPFRTLGGAFYLAACWVLSSMACARAEIIGGPVVNPANGHVYYLLSQSDWHTAETEAVNLGGHLVTINDQAEQEFVWQNFIRVYGEDAQRSFWIGLNDIANEGRFVWSSGEPVTYTHWAVGEPNNAGNGDAVYIWPGASSAESYWADLNVSATKPFPDLARGILHGIVEIVPGPPKWVQWSANGHYYALTTIAHTNWFNAEAEAASHAGGHLVSINSAEEQAFIEASFLAGNSRSNIYWIGLNDIVSEGTWVWSSGEPVTYTNWEPGEPNDNLAAEDAAVMNWSYGGFWGNAAHLGQWNDVPTGTVNTLPPARFGIMEVPSLVQHFTKVTTGPVVTDLGDSSGVAWGDYDEDGWQDLFVANASKQANFLYRNNRDGTFLKVTAAPPVLDPGDWTAGVWGDYDNDGYPDLFVAHYAQNNALLRGEGNGQFQSIAQGSIVNDGGNSYGAAWGDYDQDGNLDLFVVNRENQRNFLYRGLGDGGFMRITSGSAVSDPGQWISGTWADSDLDGDLDLFVTMGQTGGRNSFFRNDRGNFTKITAGPLVTDAGLFGGAAWGDYDNDGDLDVFVARHEQPNRLYRNDRNGIFTPVSAGALTSDVGQSLGPAWGDYDNDGDLDLFVSNMSFTGNWL